MRSVRELTPQEKFILETIEDEAAREGHPLSDLERRVLLAPEDPPEGSETEMSSVEQDALIDRCGELLRVVREREGRRFGVETARQIDAALLEFATARKSDPIPPDLLILDLVEIPKRRMPARLDRVLLWLAAAGVIAVTMLAFAFGVPEKTWYLISEGWDKFRSRFGWTIINLIIAALVTVGYVVYLAFAPVLVDRVMRKLKPSHNTALDTSKPAGNDDEKTTLVR